MTELLQKNTFSFRLATKNDITAIIELVESAYRGKHSLNGWTTESSFIDGQRTDAEEVSGLILKANSILLLCHDNNTLVATIQLEKNSNKAYLGMFAVDPMKQGKGIGYSLLVEAEKYVKNQWGCQVLQMTVITIRSELIDWYLRHGYIRTGIFKPFPYEEPRYGLPKRRDLELEILEKQLFKCE